MDVLPLNPLLRAVAPPPIAEAQGWVRGRSFPADKPLIDLAQAVPGSPPPSAMLEHLAARLVDPAVHRYTEILGMPALRQALAAHMGAFYGAEIEPGRVAITAGCNQAFCLAVMALAGPGDEVILPLPHYFNHRMWLDMQGLKAVPLSFRADAGGIPDIDEAEARIGPRTRAIVLVTPNNPTGAVYPPATIRSFYELAKRRGVALLLDETYKDFLPGDGAPHDLFSDPDWPRTLVQLYSFSKVFCLTGHRVGSLIAGPAVMECVEKAMDCVAICAPRLGQEAALFGLRECGAWVRGNTMAMRDRAEAFRSALAGVQAYRLVSIGAYFAYLEHPFSDRGATEVARGLAADQNLLTLPGPMFGAGQERFLRVAFANVDGTLAPEVAARLAESLNA
ncbi:aminotransferase [Arenibaculum pallidiluteum]|uniref:aminotransferase n=1 Tax=Arenibaculum pallidiluteum TaxID=2812559 RepID=UPI001A9776A7|nr:aminotransferase [Arenibaculum pallidiluteum]